ncbi:uncharacterized protein LY89DRAFT_92768 [Mollisia scopiformis]|uniref:Uncharacterized protein n=1 Tax=Mollisia scopiformis TaxID=149040 RepID=A0A194X672_MOLSC|nr:uncharacterized protein LY89DRAFT_92768 [Mollisia scopiformis]KUJ15681.1 hypothetical protein LY89DRAFT_92768 [Mollisia scopiformis]
MMFKTYVFSLAASEMSHSQPRRASISRRPALMYVADIPVQQQGTLEFNKHQVLYCGSNHTLSSNHAFVFRSNIKSAVSRNGFETAQWTKLDSHSIIRRSMTQFPACSKAGCMSSNPVSRSGSQS